MNLFVLFFIGIGMLKSSKVFYNPLFMLMLTWVVTLGLLSNIIEPEFVLMFICMTGLMALILLSSVSEAARVSLLIFGTAILVGCIMTYLGLSDISWNDIVRIATKGGI